MFIPDLLEDGKGSCIGITHPKALYILRLGKNRRAIISVNQFRFYSNAAICRKKTLSNFRKKREKKSSSSSDKRKSLPFNPFRSSSFSASHGPGTPSLPHPLPEHHPPHHPPPSAYSTISRLCPSRSETPRSYQLADRRLSPVSYVHTGRIVGANRLSHRFRQD